MSSLALFPLHCVLFPGGELRLRVFEPRYLELVRDCTRSDQAFGVCLIVAGREVGAPAIPAAFGCSARIVDFNVDASGLLAIIARGERRFRVERVRVRDTGLLIGEVAWLDDEPLELRAEHGLLSVLLERLLERAGSPHLRADAACYDDAQWVGFRLAELLPLSNDDRQGLLQDDDPHRRLQRILQRLPQLSD